MKAIAIMDRVYNNAGSWDVRFPGYQSILIFIFLIIGIPCRSMAQGDSLPSAESLFSGFIEKTGGQMAYNRIESRITKSKMVMSMPPITGEVTAYLTLPGLYYISIDSTGIGKIEYGSDGKIVWENSPMSGPRIREGDEKSRFRCLYSLDLPSHWKDAFKKVTIEGIDTVGGRAAYKVAAFTHEDYRIVYYFDKITSLILKLELPVKTLTGQGIQEIYYSDYKEAGGILYPHMQRRVEQGREMTLVFFSVIHNPDIPDSIFSLPDNVKRIAGGGK